MQIDFGFAVRRSRFLRPPDKVKQRESKGNNMKEYSR